MNDPVKQTAELFDMSYHRALDTIYKAMHGKPERKNDDTWANFEKNIERDEENDRRKNDI